jgi:hypothetical protein
MMMMQMTLLLTLALSAAVNAIVATKTSIVAQPIVALDVVVAAEKPLVGKSTDGVKKEGKLLNLQSAKPSVPKADVTW